MTSPTILMLLLRLVLICTVTSSIAHLYAVQSADADPLQDFCVADVNNNMQIPLNEFPCKPASDVESTDFASPLLREPRNRNQALDVAVNLADASVFPGLNTQELSMLRVDYRPRSLNPPHEHPRATELLFLVQGTLKVGFVSTDNTLFQQTLHQGDLFVFPRGLPHFQFNPDLQEPTLSISLKRSFHASLSLKRSSS